MKRIMKKRMNKHDVQQFYTTDNDVTRHIKYVHGRSYGLHNVYAIML